MARIPTMIFLLILLLSPGFCCGWEPVAAAMPPAPAPSPADPVGVAVTTYFNARFAELATIAAAAPTPETFRTLVKPLQATVDGFYDASLLSADFVITQVYWPSHALARGFDLKTVRELKPFVGKMKQVPAPQLSEPAGSFFQPRLISMRCPVFKPDGTVSAIVSLMVREEAFLKAAGLNQCRAYRITCAGIRAAEKGNLPTAPSIVRLSLPATTWVIEYEK